MRKLFSHRFWRDTRGASAGEFVLVLPCAIVLAVGSFHLCAMLFAMSGLHYAVEDAARCASVKTTVCSSGQATQNYAESRYSGPRITRQFTYAVDANCGQSVSATATYPFNAGMFRLDVPLAARACFPTLS